MLVNQNARRYGTLNAPKPINERGIALLEALIAILIFSLGILGLIGLQANATRATSAAKFRVDAGQLVAQRMADLWVDSSNLANYEGSENVGNVLPQGTLTTTVVGNRVTIVATWTIPGDSIAYEHQAVAVINAN